MGTLFKGEMVMKRFYFLVSVLALLLLAAIAHAGPQEAPRQATTSRSGYVALETPITVKDGDVYTDAGTEWVALASHGVPGDARAVVVKVVAESAVAGTAVWVSNTPDPNGGPSAHVQVAGATDSDVGETARLLTDSGQIAPVVIGRDGPCQVWVYVLGYYR